MLKINHQKRGTMKTICPHCKEEISYIEDECCPLCGLEVKEESISKLFDLNDDTKAILGKPNFTCANIAKILRASGEEIKERSEDEQAHTIYFLLKMYVEHGEEWRTKANEHLKELAEKILHLSE